MKTTLLCWIAVFFIAVTACQTPDSIMELPSVISDNMVLQRNTDVAIWGTARPGSEVNITAGWGKGCSVVTNSDSTWMANLPTSDAGGPFELSIANDDSLIVVKNVLLGEVWICSGQSNMEMPVAGWPPKDTIEGSANAIATADLPKLRMFTVVRNISPAPLTKCIGSWKMANPENVPGFSATAFFFGRMVQEKLNVPVGLIHSSWGGTPVESWISGRKLADDPDFSALVAKIATSKAESEIYESWLVSHPVVNVSTRPDGTDPMVGLDLFDAYCSNPLLNDSNWLDISLPNNIERSEIGEFDGAVWLRKVIEIPAGWVGKMLTLSLGPVDDRDVTYFNGVKIGGMEENGLWQAVRVYNIPAELVKAGKAVVAVRVIDTQGGGGMSGVADLLKIGLKGSDKAVLSLAGHWKCLPVAEFKQNVFYLFNPEKSEYFQRPKRTVDMGPYTATSLYNAMIAPLIPYTLRGAIWYQGEANVGRSTQYSRLFPLMIQNWRDDFNNPQMPFYFVQLAPWIYGGGMDGDELGDLRDAQRRTLALEQTGMAVTLDIGNLTNIHPCKKKEVGERLAFWALDRTYGMNLPFSGPLYESAEISGNVVKVNFKFADGLVLIADKINEFEVAGADGVFYPAEVKVDGNSAWVSSKKVPSPAVVRYAYRNSSVATLFNGDGLPASSFTSDETLGD